MRNKELLHQIAFLQEMQARISNPYAPLSTLVALSPVISPLQALFGQDAKLEDVIQSLVAQDIAAQLASRKPLAQ